MAIIDKEQFDENFQYYDQDTIRVVIECFIEESDERLDNIEKFIKDKDFEKLAFSAHSLKSVIGNFKAPHPYELSKILEEKAKQKSETGIDSLFKELRILISGLKIELNDYLQSID